MHLILRRIFSAVTVALVLSAVLPAAADESQSSEDSETVKEAKEDRKQARRAQLEAQSNLVLVAAEDLEVVAALEAATELVNLQQAKIDSARQRLETAEDSRAQAQVELAAIGDDIALLQEQALVYAVESYIGLGTQRTEAWLNADDATVAAHKVALLDSVSTETFDLVDQLRAVEERRAGLLADTDDATAEADRIASELAEALIELSGRQAVQVELKAELDARREEWEVALAAAEHEEADLTAQIKAEEARIERELELARLARIGGSRPGNPAVGIVSSGGWTWPTDGRPGSGFGQRLHPILGYYRMHSGQDISAPQGAPVWAASDGIVQSAGWNGGYGIAVLIGHGQSTTTLYAHMSGTAVSAGDYVTAGQVVGYIGSTGLSTGPHLHFEVRVGGVAVNPRPYLP